MWILPALAWSGREDFSFAESAQRAEGRTGRAAGGKAEAGQGRGPDGLSRPDRRPDPGPSRQAAHRRRRVPRRQEHARAARGGVGRRGSAGEGARGAGRDRLRLRRPQPAVEAHQRVGSHDPLEARRQRRSRRGPRPVAGPAAEAAAPEEEQTEFTVTLTAVGDSKINVIKAVRELTQLGLKEAKDLVDAAPKPVLENVSKADAEKAVARLKEAGATAESK